jgi:hypothetical protein
MQRDVSPWLVRGLYLLALILAVSPLVEYVSMVWPMRPGDLIWRYGALGIGAGHLPNMTVGLAALMAMSSWREHAVVFRGTAIVCLVAAALVLPVMATFALDVVQVRGLREEELRGAVLVSGALQELKYLATALALGCLGLGGMRMAGDVGAAVRPSPGILRTGSR